MVSLILHCCRLGILTFSSAVFLCANPVAAGSLVSAEIAAIASADGSGVLNPYLKRLADELQVDHIDYLPWKRAYLKALNGPDVAIFPLSRSSEREEFFTWIAPVAVLEFGFATTSGQAVDSYEAAKALPGPVGVWDGSIQYDILKSKGLENVAPILGSQTLAMMLYHGRLAAWYSTFTEMRNVWGERGFDKKLNLGKVLRRQEIWIAVSRNSGQQFEERVRAAVSSLEVSSREMLEIQTLEILAPYKLNKLMPEGSGNGSGRSIADADPQAVDR